VVILNVRIVPKLVSVEMLVLPSLVVPLNISSSPILSATIPTTVATGKRKPRMEGTPPSPRDPQLCYRERAHVPVTLGDAPLAR
jgi:hypothetical protein